MAMIGFQDDKLKVSTWQRKFSRTFLELSCCHRISQSANQKRTKVSMRQASVLYVVSMQDESIREKFLEKFLESLAKTKCSSSSFRSQF